MEIRACTIDEAGAVGEFYDGLVKFMDDSGANFPKWRYKIYPSTDYATANAKLGTQFICVEAGKIIATFALHENPEGAYEKAAWSKNLARGEYLVLHGLAIAPEFQRHGLGRKIVDFCANYAKNKNYRAIRLDIVPENFPAQKLCERCGFKFVGAVDLERGVPGIPKFCLYERNFSDDES